MLYVILGFSLVANVVLSWIVYKLLQETLAHVDNVGELSSSCDDFVSHLESIYEMEMFYGEETLKKLLEHSKELREEVMIFKEDYTIDLEDPIEEEDYEEEEKA